MKTLALLIAVPLVLGCATPPPSASRLGGTTWHFTAIDGEAPRSDRAHMTFTRDRLSASVGCNGLGANYRLVKGRIVAGPVMSTQMYCEGMMEQERAVVQLLAAKPRITMRGTLLVLDGGGHRAELHLEE
ncbi:MAG: META domain-containing protein [Novosphingobium sp.]